jgi:anaerobic C4-dicarboxylate transporter DcuA
LLRRYNAEAGRVKVRRQRARRYSSLGLSDPILAAVGCACLLWLGLAILLACILVGARVGGIGLGAVSGLGLLVFVFVLRMPPGNPPTAVLGMIIAVITALAVMQAAGGLDYLLELAEAVLRRNPARITVLAPLVTYALIFVSGTQHVIYALLPIIAEVSRKEGIRPERPLSVSVIASQQGLTASPISAVTVALIGALAGSPVGLPQILLVTIPATLVGVAAGILAVFRRGGELADDPEYRRRVAEGKIGDVEAASRLEGPARRSAIGSCAVFFAAIALVVLLGLVPALRPNVEMGRAIMIVMLACAGAIFLLFRPSAETAVKGGVMKGGVVAFVSILGVSWMGSSFFHANATEIVGAMSALVTAHPWAFGLCLFVLSILLMSQAATIVTLGPVAAAIGLPPSIFLGVYPAVNGTFFLPTYGTVLAAVSLDQTGTTRIGRFVLNHSFMVPGLVSTLTSTAVALALSSTFAR